MSSRWPERIWYGDSLSSRAARGALAPAGWLYAGLTSLRNRLYDVRLLRSITPSLPTLGVGNLSVGGTGKTPIAAWAAGELLAAGGNPAIVLRGYGGDEPLVHRQLNPLAVVIADADRVRGVARARLAGADCAILDDAFQHRRIRRLENWLLVAAEQWRPVERVLPAGPLRESRSATARATLIAVTRKSGARALAETVAARIAEGASGIPVASFHLTLDGLRNARDDSHALLNRLAGARILAIAAIGAPDEFFTQLRHAGARVEPAAYRDHHAFDRRDVEPLAERGASFDLVVCTLKDAVKLAPLWPQNGPPLWYVSQRAVVERGDEELDASLRRILAARSSAAPTAGSAGLDSPDHGYRSSTADQ